MSRRWQPAALGYAADMKRLLAAIAILIWSHAASALSIRVDFSEAVRTSTVVAWVEIERGELMTSPSGLQCGARYSARVVSAVKGVQAGQRIELGRVIGHEVGGQYFVFLNEVAPSSSATGAAAHADECTSSSPRYVETADGMGTIPIQYGEYVSYKQAVSLSDPPYDIPMALVGVSHHSGNIVNGRMIGSTQIEATNFLEYLRSLAGPR